VPQTVTREQVEAKLSSGNVVVVEALPPANFDEGHLPGALNLPHDQVDELAPQLIPDKNAEVIVYCANGPCANSGIAARRLEQLGYQHVRDYALGKADWIEAGHALEQPRRSA
jgi:rhodanese-related sulfurtransferase